MPVELSRVRIVPKQRVLVWRLLGRVAPSLLSSYWTAWRWPFGAPTIYYPTSARAGHVLPDNRAWFIARNRKIVTHELEHLQQLAPWHGPGLIAIYLLIPWVRWLMERGPYLGDIKAGAITPKRAAQQLWADYLVCVPRGYMIRWWLREANR